MSPTETPSWNPTKSPTMSPTTIPTTDPTLLPTPTASTDEPTIYPTDFPTADPTISPSVIPTINPTFNPSQDPTLVPSQDPTLVPTVIPSQSPTTHNSSNPTQSPTRNPTMDPTWNPSSSPTQTPTWPPTKVPTASPTDFPTSDPTSYPTKMPTWSPTHEPTDVTTYKVNWEAVLCCISETQIQDTIPPVADSLDVDEDKVTIVSYSALTSTRRREVIGMLEERRRSETGIDGAWDIEYVILISGIDETLDAENQLNNDTFVRGIEDSISSSVSKELAIISSEIVSIIAIRSSPTWTPTESLSISPSSALPESAVPSESPTSLPTLGGPEPTFATEGLPYVLVVVVGIGFCVIGSCALKYDYKAIKKDRAEPL